MTRAEQPTCGKGLAENAVLPAKLGDLLAAMTENLAVHMRALDEDDQNSRAEKQAYKSLVGQLQQVAAQLQATADEMAGYVDLPMGTHIEEAMKHPSVGETFKRFVEQKQALHSLLEQTSAHDKQLLETMRIDKEQE